MRFLPLPPEAGRISIALAVVLAICLFSAPAVTLTLVLVFGAILVRVYLLSPLRADNLPPRKAPGETPAEPEPLLPSSSGAFLGTRAHILRADTEMIQAHTGKLVADIERSRAMRGHIRERIDLATELDKVRSIPAVLAGSDAHAAPSTLSLREIEALLAAMPEVSASLARAIMNVFAAAFNDKVVR